MSDEDKQSPTFFEMLADSTEDELAGKNRSKGPSSAALIIDAIAAAVAIAFTILLIQNTLPHL